MNFMNNEIQQEVDKKENNYLRRELRKQSFGYIVGALSLVAGLAWNDAIKAVIEYVFPLDRNGIWVKFVYAGALTFGVILFTVYVGQVLNPPDEPLKDK